MALTRRYMNDEDGPFIAERFNEELMEDGHLDLDTIPYALDAAVQKLRSEGVGPHRWAPYIHMGA